MKLQRLALGTLFFLLVNAPYSAEPHDEARPGEKLGTVHFDTSCSAAAQPQFERAVAMLHSFWLQAGLDAFAEVARTDPGCAMAHWGTAMMWWGNPLAGPVSAKGLTEGWAAVERAKPIPLGWP